MRPVFYLLIILLAVFRNSALSQERLNDRLTPSLQAWLKEKGLGQVFQVIVKSKDIIGLRNRKDIRFLYTYGNTAVMQASGYTLQQLIADDKIQFADINRKAKEELTTGAFDLTLNKVNLVHRSFPFINGDSIGISIKEQRFDTNDIDIRNRYFTTGLEAGTQFTHASIMATIIAGGGNSSSYAKGVAWGASVTSSDFARLLPDPDSIYQRYRISVQNHSYGTGIENYYGADAAAYDQSAQNNPSLVYVFSSGNSGTETSTAGNYNGLPGVSNLTGSFKMAKNILAVGATDSFNKVADQSSKGPAYDGRIKPELVAYGEDGTSGAAALVSGSAALLQQAFQVEHNRLPGSELVRAVLLNSADPVNDLPLSYSSGYGSLNTFNALQTLREHRYIEDSVSQGEVKSYLITVPAGIAALKLTLAWNDLPALPMSNKALINDLDLSLQYKVTGEIVLPWVLNSASNKDSLLLPPRRKTDTLNNTEKISITSPAQGSYLVQVRGTSLSSALQSFAVVWQLDTAQKFSWTYPAADEQLPAGHNVLLRWQTNRTGNADADYSFDGVNWFSISQAVSLQDQQLKWAVPDTTATVIVRMHSDSINILSDTFVISRTLNMHVGFNCTDSFMLFWNKTNADQYRVYELGQKYMQPFLATEDTLTIIKQKNDPSLFYSVAPVVSGKEGLRSLTLNYMQQGVECYIHTFYASLFNDTAALLTTELGTLYQVAAITIQKADVNSFRTISTFTGPKEVALSFMDRYLTQGANTYRIQIKLINGAVINSDEQTVYYFPHNPVLLYPNPARHNEPIRMISALPGAYTVYIYDANGRWVGQYYLSDFYQQIDALKLVTGIYFIRITGEGNKTYFQKLVVY